MLNADYKQKFSGNPSTKVGQAKECLIGQFENLKVSQTVYRFMTNKHALSIKKAYFYLTDRNSPGKIQ